MVVFFPFGNHMPDLEVFYKNLLDNLYDGVYFVDTHRRILYWNKGAERITGYGPDDVVGRFCFENILNHISYTGVCLCTGDCPLKNTIKDGQYRETEAFLHHKTGHRIPVLIRTSPIYDESGKVKGAVEIFSDNSAHFQTRIEKTKLEQAVYQDALTGIYNRSFIEIKAKSALMEFQSEAIPFGLLFIDLDNFKDINDSYGHLVGDLVLKMVANTLAHNLRSIDQVGRWGGEEFLVVAQNIDQDNLVHLADKIRILVGNSSMDLNGEKIRVTVSVGATMAKENDSLDAIIDRADLAQYTSKANGRNQVTLR
jgi:diguanylate cyclase (GGDEF)-like protein/PAS domain S-box-containing protein